MVCIKVHCWCCSISWVLTKVQYLSTRCHASSSASPRAHSPPPCLQPPTATAPAHPVGRPFLGSHWIGIPRLELRFHIPRCLRSLRLPVNYQDVLLTRSSSGRLSKATIHTCRIYVDLMFQLVLAWEHDGWVWQEKLRWRTASLSSKAAIPLDIPAAKTASSRCPVAPHPHIWCC